MKRIIALIPSALLLFSLFGCLGTNNKGTDDTDAPSLEEDEKPEWAMKSDNFTVTPAMMNYYFNTLYQQYSGIYSQMGLDTSKDLKSQPYNEGTWHDYFMEMTEDNVRQLLVLCEAAKAADYKLDDCYEHDHSADTLLKEYETYAKMYGISLNHFLESTYGEGVNAKVIKQCYEISTLASHYSEHIIASYEFSYEELEKYYLENNDSFENADYNLKSFRYIPFEKSYFNDNEEDAKEAAEYALATFQTNPTEERFAVLSDEYAFTSYRGGLVENVDKGAIGDEVDAWLYDSQRSFGDSQVITVDGKGSYLIYYIGNGDVKWQHQAKNALTNDRYTLEYAGLEKEHAVEYSEEGLSEVDVPLRNYKTA